MSLSHSRGNDYACGRGYAWYALFLLMLVAAFNLIDRMIVTILAGEVKLDLGLSDAELGLLYGTFFAIFYALFGIPLGRLGDTWKRTRLVPLGLAGWSLMTMLSGLSNNMGQFAATRIGVGIGEASSGPAATSLLSDYFPTRLRGTALALFSCGIPIGVGLSMVLGGAIVEQWNAWYPAGDFPLGLKGWQAAFIAVAAPGLLLALLVARLKDPPRGVSEGVLQAPDPHPFRKCGRDLMAVIPPLIWFNFRRLGVDRRVWIANFAVLIALVLMVLGVSSLIHALVPPKPDQVYATWAGLRITGHTAQWASLALGIYCVFSWSQSLACSDRPAHRLIFATPALMALVVAGGLFMVMTHGLMAWAPFFAVTRYHESIATVGLKFGTYSAVAGLMGTALGGLLGDRLRRGSPRGRLYVSLLAMTLPAPLAWFTLSRQSLDQFLFAFVFLSVVTTAWLPGMLSTIQDLVLPRMRGLVYAVFVLGMTIIGLGCGPYLAGLVSDATGKLGTGILSLYLLTPLIGIVMLFAISQLDRAETTRLDRARAAGEILEAEPGIPGGP